MPKALWDSLGRYRIIGAMCGYGLLVVLVLHLAAALQVFDVVHLGGGWVAYYINHLAIPTSVPLLLVLVVIPRIAIRRFFSYARRRNCELCKQCGYCLCGLPLKHNCPECGAAFDIDDTRGFWHSLMEDNIGKVD